MQLRQEYTINNTTFKNELFISEKDNADIYAVIHHFFNSPITANNVKNICIIPANINNTENTETACTEEKTDVQENSPAVNVPVEHEEKKADVKVKVSAKKESELKNTSGYFVKFLLNNQLFKKWSAWKSEKKAKDAVYYIASKQRKEKGYDVKCEILDIQPMTLEEFNNIQ